MHLTAKNVNNCIQNHWATVKQQMLHQILARHPTVRNNSNNLHQESTPREARVGKPKRHLNSKRRMQSVNTVSK